MDKYIVLLDQDRIDTDEKIRKIANDSLARSDISARPDETFEFLDGYTVELNEVDAERLADNPFVDAIIKDREIWAFNNPTKPNNIQTDSIEFDKGRTNSNQGFDFALSAGLDKIKEIEDFDDAKAEEIIEIIKAQFEEEE